MEEAPGRAGQARPGKWKESIAAGSRNLVRIMKGEPGMGAKGGGISGTDGEPGLREPQAPYGNDFEGDNGFPGAKKGCF